MNKRISYTLIATLIAVTNSSLEAKPGRSRGLGGSKEQQANRIARSRNQHVQNHDGHHVEGVDLDTLCNAAMENQGALNQLVDLAQNSPDAAQRLETILEVLGQSAGDEADAGAVPEQDEHSNENDHIADEQPNNEVWQQQFDNAMQAAHIATEHAQNAAREAAREHEVAPHQHDTREQDVIAVSLGYRDEQHQNEHQKAIELLIQHCGNYIQTAQEANERIHAFLDSYRFEYELITLNNKFDRNLVVVKNTPLTQATNTFLRNLEQIVDDFIATGQDVRLYDTHTNFTAALESNIQSALEAFTHYGERYTSFLEDITKEVEHKDFDIYRHNVRWTIQREEIKERTSLMQLFQRRIESEKNILEQQECENRCRIEDERAYFMQTCQQQQQEECKDIDQKADNMMKQVLKIMKPQPTESQSVAAKTGPGSIHPMPTTTKNAAGTGAVSLGAVSHSLIHNAAPAISRMKSRYGHRFMSSSQEREAPSNMLRFTS